MCKCSFRQEGFTLVELMVALTIFAIGLLAIAGMQITSIKSDAQAQRLTTGSAVAQMVLEEVLSLRNDDPIFDTAAVNTYDFDHDPDVVEATLTDPNLPAFVASYTITPNYSGATDLALVAVSVSGGNLSGTIKLTGLKRVR